MMSPNEIKKQTKKEARRDLIMTNAVIELVKDNDLACVIHINGIELGICQNRKIMPALRHHKTEIEKFLRGSNNEWE